MTALLMLCYKLWIENRMRFFVVLAITLCSCLLYVFFEGQLHPELLKQRPGAVTYSQFVYWRIYSAIPRVLFQVSCIVLALGGVQRERRQGTIAFSLALPVPRSWHELTRAGVGLAEVALAPFTALGLTWVVSLLRGADLDAGTMLIVACLWAVGGMATFAMAFLCSAIVPGEYTALAVAQAAYLFELTAARLPSLRAYPLHVTDLMNGKIGGVIDTQTLVWTGHLPVGVLLAYAATTAILIGSATLISRRMEV